MLKKGGGLNNKARCPICIGYTVSTDYLELECGHTCHYNCFIDIIENNAKNNIISRCPQCPITIKNIYNVTTDLSTWLSDNPGKKPVDLQNMITESHKSIDPIITLSATSQMSITPAHMAKHARMRGHHKILIAHATLLKQITEYFADESM